MLAAKRLTEQVCKEYAAAINAAEGNEVFAVGNINEDGIVDRIEICARGHESAVPVTKAALNCSVLIHNHPSGVLIPSEADLGIANRAAENGQGFYIVDNEVFKIYVVVEPIKPKKLQKLDISYISAMLSAGGALDKISENFEERPAQVELTKSIAKSFNNSLVGIFEAGTGVGKSFAYLLPSMLWAINNKERVIISTGTINLQQQLIEKDIPFAEKIIDKKVKAVLVKGRQNYLCRRRLADANRERELFDEDTEQFEMILAWEKTTDTGSRSDLAFFPNEVLWGRVNSESDACMGMRCPYFENCFVMKVRKEASDAQVLVVNHHMLFSDLEARIEGAGYEDTAVLPPYKRIVFDEAHGMEHAATSFFSEQLNRFKILKQLNLLYRTRRGAVAGHLFTLEALSNRGEIVADVMQLIEDIKDHLNELEEEALALMENDFTWRLYEKTAESSTLVLEKMDILYKDIANLSGKFRSLFEGIAEKDLDMPAVWESKKVVARLENAGAVCKWFIEWQERPETIFWADKVRYKNKYGSGIYPRFYATPLDIAPKMQQGVFEPLSTVVCASATLKSNNSFNYWNHRTGAAYVPAERILCREFESPFPYHQNLLLAIPNDIPMPDSRDFQPAVEEAVIELIEAAKGRTLALFTSYESLRSACEHAREVLAPKGIMVLRQGEDDRFRLLETFKSVSSSVLFATDSFWEGVDVPGESLSQVIIAKLPFSVPTDPIFAARSEALLKRGGNPFMDLSLPEAVIKFRQGFGRLMRKSTDRGVVTVLDRRIIEKRYGSIFLNSIPKTKFCHSSLQEVLEAVERFL